MSYLNKLLYKTYQYILKIYIKESQPRDAIRAGKATIIMPIEAVAAKSDVLTIKNYLKSTINY